MSEQIAKQIVENAPGLVPTPVAPVEKPVEVQEDIASKRFAHLAQKEAEIVKEKRALSEEKERLRPIYEKYQEYEKLKKTNPVEALKILEFNEQDLFNYLAQKEPPKEFTPEEKIAKTAEDAAQAKIKAWEEEQAKKQKEEQDKKDQALIQEFKSDIGKVLESDKDKFEYCNHYGAIAEDLIYETVIAAVKQSDGKEIMTALEAAELVENYYEEQDKAMSNLKKRKPVEEPKVDAPKTPERTRTVTAADPNYQQKPLITKTRTLNSQATATSASMATKHETAAEKRLRLETILRTGDTALLRKQ